MGPGVIPLTDVPFIPATIIFPDTVFCFTVAIGTV